MGRECGRVVVAQNVFLVIFLPRKVVTQNALCYSPLPAFVASLGPLAIHICNRTASEFSSLVHNGVQLLFPSSSRELKFLGKQIRVSIKAE